MLFKAQQYFRNYGLQTIRTVDDVQCCCNYGFALYSPLLSNVRDRRLHPSLLQNTGLGQKHKISSKRFKTHQGCTG